MSLRYWAASLAMVVLILAAGCSGNPLPSLLAAPFPGASADPQALLSPTGLPLPAVSGSSALSPGRSGGVAIAPFTAHQVEALATLRHQPSVTALSSVHDRSRLTLVGAFSVKLWDTFTGQELGHPIDQGERLYAAALSSDGSRLATGDAAGTITLWDVLSGEIVVTLAGHAGHLVRLAFSPDGATWWRM